MRKRVKWTKNPLNHEMFMLLRRGILLNGKYIKREMYVLIICEHFGTKLF
jgi:hypothetical protein